MEKVVFLPIRSSWGNSHGPGDVQSDFGPSMCEPVHNLTLEEIIRDYSRGIVHTTRQAFYDDGEDVHDVEDFEDVVDLVVPEDISPNLELGSSQAPEENVPEKETPSDPEQ